MIRLNALEGATRTSHFARPENQVGGRNPADFQSRAKKVATYAAGRAVIAVERLREKVRDAVDCRAGAEVVVELFRVAGAPSRAADLIESALATARP